MKKSNIYLSLFVSLLSFVLSTTQTHAQDMEAEYNAFLRQRVAEMQEFKNNRDKEFANFLKENWEVYKTMPGVSQQNPGPQIPVVYTPKEQKKTTSEPNVDIQPPNIDSVKIAENVKIPVESIKPQQTVTPESTKRGNLHFLGGYYSISLPQIKVYLPQVNETGVSEAWSNVAKSDYKTLIDDCINLKKELQLNDWGYVELTKQVASQITASANTNETTFLQAFILLQSDYDIKMAYINQELGILIATEQELYNVTYTNISGRRYYVLINNRLGAVRSVKSYSKNFGSASKRIDMNIYQVPLLADAIVTKTFSSEKSPLSVHAEVNKNLIELYNTMPQTIIPVYMNAAVNSKFGAHIIKQLKTQLEGKTVLEQANMLLHFIQQAFPYRVDSEQFGYEKPYFIEDCFFFPYSDCEDRAVLYAYLVHNILGLEVVLLQYPEHIATAVCFNEDVKGDYVDLKGEKFTICDPTYINAPVGVCMTAFKQIQPSIYMYNK